MATLRDKLIALEAMAMELRGSDALRPAPSEHGESTPIGETTIPEQKQNPEMGDKEGADRADLSDTPFYVQDRRRRSARMGISAEVLREQELASLAATRFPAPECLMADEVLVVATHQGDERRHELSEPRMSHYRSCLYCQAMVASCLPEEKLIEG